MDCTLRKHGIVVKNLDHGDREKKKTVEIMTVSFTSCVTICKLPENSEPVSSSSNTRTYIIACQREVNHSYSV